LRTSFWVPVWQNVQESVQPTWLDRQSVPRPSSGMYTVSISTGRPAPRGGKRRSHLMVPSADTCSVTISGRVSE
jgi:hypothetical protein